MPTEILIAIFFFSDEPRENLVQKGGEKKMPRKRIVIHYDPARAGFGIQPILKLAVLEAMGDNTEVVASPYDREGSLTQDVSVGMTVFYPSQPGAASQFEVSDLRAKLDGAVGQAIQISGTNLSYVVAGCACLGYVEVHDVQMGKGENQTEAPPSETLCSGGA